jgi:hypothetical protein
MVSLTALSTGVTSCRNIASVFRSWAFANRQASTGTRYPCWTRPCDRAWARSCIPKMDRKPTLTRADISSLPGQKSCIMPTPGRMLSPRKGDSRPGLCSKCAPAGANERMHLFVTLEHLGFRKTMGGWNDDFPPSKHACVYRQRAGAKKND